MQKRRFTALIAGLAASAALGFSMPATAQQYKDEYKLSTVLGEAFPWGWGAKRWADLVAEKTEGRIKIKVYPGTSLVSGDQTKEFTALRQGIIDMAVGSTINWSPQVPELNLFSLPFLMKNDADLDAITQGEAGKLAFAAIEQRGIVPLAWGENGFRQLSNSAKPVRSPADLAGLKIRVVGSPLFQDTFTALGANPTQMSWADAKPALTTGAVDGQENPLSVFDVARVDQVGQKYLTLWDYMADPLVFAVNQRVWKSLPEEDRELLSQAAIDAGKWEIELSRGAQAQRLADVRERGVEVIELSDAERAAFVEATASVHEKWAPRIGDALMGAARKAVAQP